MFRLVRWLLLPFCLWILVFIEQGIAQSVIPAAKPTPKITPKAAVNSTLSSTSPVYRPLSLVLNNDVSGILSDRDIPLGDGGFARDYVVQLTAGDQVAIDLVSDNFDPVVALLTRKAKTIGKNDDGPDGTSNSLLFARIKTTDTYIVRVQGFSDTSGGNFTLRVNRLRTAAIK